MHLTSRQEKAEHKAPRGPAREESTHRFTAFASLRRAGKISRAANQHTSSQEERSFSTDLYSFLSPKTGCFTGPRVSSFRGQ